MGTLIDAKKTLPSQHIHQSMVASESINVGNSGVMKVDPRFQVYGTSKPTGQIGAKKSASQALSSQQIHDQLSAGHGLVSLLANPSFKYSLVGHTSTGKKVSLLDVIKNDERTSATNSYFTGKYHGEAASQIAHELQARYSKTPSLASMKKLTPQQMADDQMKIAYLTEFLNSKKLSAMYKDPAFLKAYPKGKTTYLPLIEDAKYRATVQAMIENYNRGIQVFTENQDLQKYAHYRHGAHIVKSVKGVKTEMTDSDYSHMMAQEKTITRVSTLDLSKASLAQVKRAATDLEGLSTLYDSISVIPPNDRSIRQSITFDMLDIKLKQLQQLYINVKTYERIKEREKEQHDINTFQESNNANIAKVLSDLRALPSKPQSARKGIVDGIIDKVVAYKTSVLNEQKKYPHIMKESNPPSEDHKVIASCYTNWAALFRWVN